MPRLEDFSSGPPEVRRTGMITEWMDDKGYGWAEPGGKRYFAHIKEFEPGQGRPRSGGEVHFIPGFDPGWRVPESSLHLGELFGGWPGAFLAQHKLRHKCPEPGYQFVFRAIVLLYQMAALDVILHQRLSRAVMAFLNQ